MFRTIFTSLIALVSVTLLASVGLAQTPDSEAPEAPPAQEEVEAEVPETPETPEPTPDVPPTPQDTPEEPVEPDVMDSTPDLDPDDPLYWSSMRGIYTVQKRAFQKEGRFALSVYGGIIPNNAFEKYVPFGIRINYFILENLGLELASSYALKVETGLQSVLEEPEGAAAQQVLVGDTQLSHTNFGVIWSPFYGKTAFYDSALNYFDFYLFAGAGLVITETIPDFNEAAESDFKPEGALGAGLAFYLGDNAAVRFDFRQFVFQKVEGIGGVANPSEISLGFGWFF